MMIEVGRNECASAVKAVVSREEFEGECETPGEAEASIEPSRVWQERQIEAQRLGTGE